MERPVMNIKESFIFNDMLCDTIENLVILEKVLNSDGEISLALGQYALEDLKRNINYFNKNYPCNYVTERFTEEYAIINAQYQLRYGLDLHKP